MKKDNSMLTDDLILRIYNHCKNKVESSFGPMNLQEENYALIFESMKHVIKTDTPLDYLDIYKKVFNQLPPKEFNRSKSIDDFINQFNIMHGIPHLSDHQNNQVAVLATLMYEIANM